MASQLKRQAAEALATYLTPFVQAVAPSAPVMAVQADYEVDQVYPSVVVVPQRMKFTQWIDDETEKTTSTELFNVGDFEGTAEVRVAGLGKYDRDAVEQAILDALLADDVPGLVVLQAPAILVGGTQYTHQPLVSFELSEEDWREEMVMQAERYSYLTLDMAYEALVSRTVPDIDQLILAFTVDLDSDPSSLVTENGQVNEDGTLTKL